MNPVTVTLVCSAKDQPWAQQIAQLVNDAWHGAFSSRIARYQRDVLGGASDGGVEGILTHGRKKIGGHLGVLNRSSWHARPEVPDLIAEVNPEPEGDGELQVPDTWFAGVLRAIHEFDLVVLLTTTAGLASRVSQLATASDVPLERVLVLAPGSRGPQLIWLERFRETAPKSMPVRAEDPVAIAKNVLHKIVALLSRTQGDDPTVANFSGGDIWRAFFGITSTAVNLALGVPRAVEARAPFSVRFAAYTPAREASVLARLASLSAGTVEPVTGLAPEELSRWRKGTPVRVRVSGRELEVSPLEQEFKWNGMENLLTFIVTASDGRADRTLHLRFDVSIEGVMVASIAADVVLKAGASDQIDVTKSVPARSAFASYASADGKEVSQCLSALLRWEPAIDIFMDCLDLTPNAEWQRELARIIPQKTAFLLFWSRNAIESRWVNWELDTAIRAHGPERITPMPLEDPDIAPPPAMLDHRQFRDRFLVAKAAFENRRRVPGTPR